MSIITAAQSGVNAVKNGRAYVDNLANKYIMGPKFVKGIGGFVFDYEGRTSIKHQAAITDHYTENNTVINYHVAIQPVKLNLSGFVSELTLKSPAGLLGALDKLQSKLGVLPAYLGNSTPQMAAKLSKALTTAANVTNNIDNAITRTGNIVGLLKGNIISNLLGNGIKFSKQQQAYEELESLYNTKQLMWVSTPYKAFENMVIEALDFTQDDDTKTITDISVTLKQIRFASVTFVAYDPSIFSAKANAQKKDLVNAGTTKGDPKDLHSIAYDLVVK